MLVNLVTNASKYSPAESEITVTVEEKKAKFCFCVEDRGSGISSEDQSKLFNSYFQLKAHTNKPGTGLGLTICKKIIEGLGGQITVESALGEGSRFYFHVPATPNNYFPYDLDQLKSQLSNTKILLVDDHVQNRVLFSKMLLDIETIPILCSSGSEALQCIRIQSFSLILVDICMDEMNGIELAEKIRELELPMTKIVALSSLVGTLSNTDMFEEVLYKPFTAQQLYQTIAKTLGISPQSSPTITPVSGNQTPIEPLALARNVLVVDDDPSNLDTLVQMISLLKPEYEIFKASSGSQALEKLGRIDHIDYLFLDLRMPGISGFDILEKLKEGTFMKVVTKTVVFTASVSCSEQITNKYSIDNFLTKPVQLKELEKVLF